ncbi:MAG: flagellar export protein FliJ [bacterium]|nr:flagellar export protein FliJ [bacterium]
MAKFFYSMQNILELKLKMEDQAKNDYAVVKAHLDEEIHKLNAIFEQKAEYESKLKNQVSDRLIIVDIIQSGHAIKALEYKIEDQKRAVTNAERRVNLAKAKMQEAMIERKTQEKLKENAFELFKQELVEVENKENDELVSFKYNKSGKGV